MALLHALAREEAAGRRPARLTEPGQATWQRFRGRLGSGDLLRLLAQDGAVVHPLPFAAHSLDSVDNALVDAFLAALPALESSPAAYIEAQARRLSISTELARAELPEVKPHEKLLELPGTGGQLSHHLVSTQGALTLQQNCTIACQGWAELTLAGLVALDRAAPSSAFVSSVTPDELRNPAHPLRQRRFDVVVGLRPDKGGQFQIEDQLAVWFHDARVVLV